MNEHEAVAFDMPNGQHPGYENRIYYGDRHVPKPNNAAAERVMPEKVMKQVMEAR